MPGTGFLPRARKAPGRRMDPEKPEEPPMCLSTKALILFISLLPQEIVTPSDNGILIHAETGPVAWVADGETWCTFAPLRTAAEPI